MNKYLFLFLSCVVSTSQATQVAYVADYTNNTVTPIDLTTNTPGKTISTAGAHGGSEPTRVVITSNNRYVNVTNTSGGTHNLGDVVVIDTHNNNAVTSIEDENFNGPGGMAIDLHGIAYVTNVYSNKISYFPTPIASWIRTLYVGATPLNIAITRDGKYLYVTNSGSDSISVYDISGSSPMFFATIEVTNPYDIAITPDNKMVYVTNNNAGSVTYFPVGQEDPPLRTITVGSFPAGIAITRDGQYAYVANQNSSTVSMIQLSTNMVVATIKLPSVGGHIAIANNFVYVSSHSTVSYFAAGQTNPTVMTINGFTMPMGIAITTTP